MPRGLFRAFMRFIDKEAFPLLLCLIVVLLSVGGLYALTLGGTIRYWDEQHYFLLSQHLHQGIYSFDGQTPTAFQPPGYPLALYSLSWLSGSLSFLRFVNFIFLSVSIALLFWMLRKEQGNVAAILGAFTAGLYPLFFYSSGTLYPQIFSSMIFILTLSLILLQSRIDWRGEVLIGLLVGFLILVIPSFLLYLPLWCIYPWFVRAEKRLRAMLLLLLGCGAVVGCWTVRNVVTFDRFVLISTNGGVNLLLGNSEHTTPTSGVLVDLHPYVTFAEGMDEFDQDRYYRDEAIKWIKKNPFQALNLYLLKSLNFFNFENTLASKSEESQFNNILSFISFYPVLLLMFGRLVWAVKNPLKPFEWYLLLFFLCSPFLQAIFFTRIRFRIPFDFIAIYFAASCLQLLLLSVTGHQNEVKE